MPKYKNESSGAMHPLRKKLSDTPHVTYSGAEDSKKKSKEDTIVDLVLKKAEELGLPGRRTMSKGELRPEVLAPLNNLAFQCSKASQLLERIFIDCREMSKLEPRNEDEKRMFEMILELKAESLFFMHAVDQYCPSLHLVRHNNKMKLIDRFTTGLRLAPSRAIDVAKRAVKPMRDFVASKNNGKE